MLSISIMLADSGFDTERASDGELLITSRQDGTIRMLVPDSRGEN